MGRRRAIRPTVPADRRSTDQVRSGRVRGRWLSPTRRPTRPKGAGRGLAHGQHVLTLGLAALVFWLAYDSGSFPLLSRTSLAILVWWVIGVGVVVGLWPRTRPTKAALTSRGRSRRSPRWTALSLAWTSNDQATFDEVGRTLLYLGVFALVVLAAPWTGVRAWADALPLAIGVVVVLALSLEAVPGHVHARPRSTASCRSARRASTTRSATGTASRSWRCSASRSSYGSRSRDDPRSLRAAAVAVVPGAAGRLPGVVTRRGRDGVVGALAFVALTRRRVHALVALAVGCVGAAAAVAVLRARPELTNDPGAAAAVSQGHQAAALLVVVTLLTGAAYAGADDRLFGAASLRAP